MPLHDLQDCNAVEEVLKYENEWFNEIGKHFINSNANLVTLRDQVNALNNQLTCIKTIVFNERKTLLEHYYRRDDTFQPISVDENVSKEAIERLSQLLDKSKYLYDRQLVLLNAEKEFREYCLIKHNSFIRQCLTDLNNQITFYKSAIQNLNEDRLYVISETFLGDVKKVTESIDKADVDDHYLTISQKIKSKLHQKAHGGRTEIERRHKFIEKLQKQQIGLDKLIDSCKEKTVASEKHYQDEVSRLNNAIECARANIKTTKRRKRLDYEGFLSDVKLLYQRLLKVQRQVREPTFKEAVTAEVQQISVSLRNINDKISRS